MARALRPGGRLAVVEQTGTIRISAVFPNPTYAKDAYDCAAGADFLVLATEWNEFRGLDLEKLGAALTSRTMVDLRNVYDPTEIRAAGWNYTSVGRP